MAEARISVPGTYRGFSAQTADGYRRSSNYIVLSDGCRLAVDLYRPTLQGALLAGQCPTVVVFTGYRRAFRFSAEDPAHVRRRYPHLSPGDIATHVGFASHLPDGVNSVWAFEQLGARRTGESLADWLRLRGSACEYLLVHGYAVVVVDTRGTGASFGQNYGDGWQCGKDLSEVFEYLTTQDWCPGEFGMIGSSWLGGTQYFAMTYGARRLRAAIPQMASFDVYDSWYPGGVYLSGFLRQWSERRSREDTERLALPVDEDQLGSLLQQAIAERIQTPYPTDKSLDTGLNVGDMPNWSRDEMGTLFPMKNLPLPDGGFVDLDYSALDFKRARNNGTAVYFWGGWWDMFMRGMSVAFWNMPDPKKFLVGPWHHSNYWDLEESHRWFDYWLRDIANGIAEEPPMVYATSEGDGTVVGWRFADHWPIAEAARKQFALDRGDSAGSDGRLVLQADGRHVPTGSDSLVVDYAASSGRGSRVWYHLQPHLSYGCLVANDRTGLVYETAALGEQLAIAGFPRLTIHVASTARSGVIFAYLEEIDPAGRVHLISDGLLNLQFRAEQISPLETDGLIHRSYAAFTRQPVIPGEIMQVRIDLAPISCRIKAGHRLRLALQGADADNYYTEVLNPPPTLTLFRGAQYPSVIELPVVTDDGRYIDDAFRDLPHGRRYACTFESG